MVVANAFRIPRPLSLGAVAGALCLTGPPQVAAESPPGFYFGADIGLSSFSVEDDTGGCCYYFPSYTEGDNSSALELDFGYRVNKYLAAELGYLDTSPEWQENLVYVPELNDVYNNFADVDLQAVQLSAVGILPFGKIWEAYLRGGVVFWQGDTAQTLVRVSDSTVVTRSLSESSTDFVLAIGIGVNLRPAWQIKVEFQGFGVDRNLISASGSTSIDVVQIGFQFHPGARRNPPASGSQTAD